MQLAVPITYKDGVYDQCEIKKPKTGVLGDTLDVFENQGDFQAILELLSRSIISFTSIENKSITYPEQIRAICRRMPYVAAEAVAIQCMLLINKEDWIEGVYVCPRCRKQTVTGVDSYGEDNRDRIEDLRIIKQGENESGEIDQGAYNNYINLNLTDAVKIKHGMTGDVIHQIDSLHIRYPTIDDCIKGSAKYPESKEMKRQLAIYSEAIEKVNDEEVKIKFKKTWGEYIFRELDPDDMEYLGKEMSKFGLRRYIEKTCKFCGKVWDAPVNTSNFFESGLRSA